MSVSLKTTKFLCMRSGGICAICHCAVVFSEKVNLKGHIGEIAHIFGENSGAKRYCADMTDEDRNNEPNLLVLCPNCHSKIDGFEFSQYPPARLQEIKRNHEVYIESRLQEFAATQVSYTEIEIVLSFLQGRPGNLIPDNYKLIEIKQKIGKNNLSASSEALLNVGFLRDKDVEEYISCHPDPNYSNSLRERLVKIYNDKLDMGFLGDYLMEEIASELCPNPYEFKKRAAALAVIAYFFRICDIFEK